MDGSRGSGSRCDVGGGLRRAKYTDPIYVYKTWDGSGYISGTPASARNLGDTSVQLSCFYENYPPSMGAYRFATCYAYDGSQYASCSTNDPWLTETLSKIQSDSYVWVAFDKAGTCTRVQIGSESYSPPKAP